MDRRICHPQDPHFALRRTFQVLFTLCTVGTVVFIFSNSMEIAAVSGGKSASVTLWTNLILEKIGVSLRVTEQLVRKGAHLAEYALLGFWLTLTLRVYTKKILTHCSIPLFFGLAIPVADEFLQLYVPGRSGQVRDVVIDFTGVLAGVFCGLFLLLLVRMFTVLRQSREPL